MSDLTVTLIQKDLEWEDPTANLASFESTILKDTSPSDLVILPEMFTTGFSMKPQLFAEDMNGPSVLWMQRMAQQTQKTLVGSLIIKENNQYFNRLIWVSPNGQIQTYNKRHLFSYGKEDQHYHAGKTLLETQLRTWKIRPLICYDLRFPVWSRNTTDYDLLIYVANWPKRRIQHWKSLLVARAIENQSFVIGLNRVGVDGNGIVHDGNSLIISPQGHIQQELQEGATTITFQLERKILTDYRANFPALKDRD